MPYFCGIILTAMKLTNQQILNFVGRIKLPHVKKQDYNDQIDLLKKRVVGAINGIDNTKVKNVWEAGSWKKGTALRPRGDALPLDVDLVFFVEVDEETKFDSEELRNEIITVLKQAYPNKSEEDFESGEKTVGIVFRGSGLEVDIVPFIPNKGNPSYGRQPRKELKSGDFKTSVEKQLKFISGVKSRWASFAPVVRMVKWWKNEKELDMPSFAVELLFAHLILSDRIGGSITIEDALIKFFEFVSSNPCMRIGFPDAIGSLPASSGVPVVADPTNNENNVLEKIDTIGWSEIVDKATSAFETLSYARTVGEQGKTLELWREVFDQFNIQDIQEA